MMSVAVNIVTWNGKEFLPHLLKSLMAQTVKPKRILVIDNGSVDGTLELLKEWPTVHVLRNNRNLGFAHGYNQGFALSDADAVLIANQDLILDPRCIERLVAELERDRTVGSVCPLAYRFSFTEGDLREPLLSGTIDTAGLTIRRSRQAINIDEGRQPDEGAYRSPSEIFGVHGVLALFRKTALQDVAFHDEYFDDDFFAYKEDVDLAWRLRWAGWSARLVPAAVVYHYRTLTHHGDRIAAVFKTRSGRSPKLRTLSYRNHLLMLIKNETPDTFIPDFPFILLYELKRLVYLLFREWPTLAAIPQALRLVARMRRKRAVIKRTRRIDSKTFRSFIRT